jgi:hypothetical protein
MDHAEYLSDTPRADRTPEKARRAVNVIMAVSRRFATRNAPIASFASADSKAS